MGIRLHQRNICYSVSPCGFVCCDCATRGSAEDNLDLQRFGRREMGTVPVEMVGTIRRLNERRKGSVRIHCIDHGASDWGYRTVYGESWKDDIAIVLARE